VKKSTRADYVARIRADLPGFWPIFTTSIASISGLTQGSGWLSAGVGVPLVNNNIVKIGVG
jgi:hypothetical protein